MCALLRHAAVPGFPSDRLGWMMGFVNDCLPVREKGRLSEFTFFASFLTIQSGRAVIHSYPLSKCERVVWRITRRPKAGKSGSRNGLGPTGARTRTVETERPNMQMYPRIIAESSCLPPARPRVGARCGNGSRFLISQIHMGSQREVKAVTKMWLQSTSASICMSWLICRQIFKKKALHGKICCPSFRKREGENNGKTAMRRAKQKR